MRGLICLLGLLLVACPTVDDDDDAETDDDDADEDDDSTDDDDATDDDDSADDGSWFSMNYSTDTGSDSVSWTSADGAVFDCDEMLAKDFGLMLFAPVFFDPYWDGEFVRIWICGGLSTDTYSPGEPGFECENGPGIIAEFEMSVGATSAAMPWASTAPCEIVTNRDGDWFTGTFSCTLNETVSDSPDVLLSGGSFGCPVETWE